MASLQPVLKKILDVKSSAHTRVSKQVSKLLLGILTNNEHSFSPSRSWQREQKGHVDVFLKEGCGTQ